MDYWVLHVDEAPWVSFVCLLTKKQIHSSLVDDSINRSPATCSINTHTHSHISICISCTVVSDSYQQTVVELYHGLKVDFEIGLPIIGGKCDIFQYYSTIVYLCTLQKF